MNICIAHGGDLSEPSGGTDRIAAFANGLRDTGHVVFVVCPRPERALDPRLSDIELRTVPISAGGVLDQLPRAVLVSRQAHKIASNRDAVLQIEHSTLAGISTLLGRSEFVLDMHDFAFASPIYGDLPLGTAIQSVIRRLEERAIRRANRIIVVSNRMRDFVIDEWDVSRNRLTVIPNGYSLSTVESHRGIQRVDGRVVFLGTLHPKVDIQAFIEIAQSPSVHEMIVIGDGEQRAELEKHRRRLDLSNLKVMGRLPDDEAFELLASASVAINPQFSSRLQLASSPVKLYYYAALECPMVLTEGPEAVSWLAELNAAVAVPPDDSFVDAVESVLKDENQRRRLAENARTAGVEATWSSRVDDLIALYDSFD